MWTTHSSFKSRDWKPPALHHCLSCASVLYQCSWSSTNDQIYRVLFYYSEACYTLFTAFLLFLFKTLYPFLFIPSLTISLFSWELPELLRAAWCWADRAALKDQTSVFFPSFYSSSRLLSIFQSSVPYSFLSIAAFRCHSWSIQYGNQLAGDLDASRVVRRVCFIVFKPISV